MDTEQWMRHRQLPQQLRQSVRKYDQYKWIATRGVDEEALLKGLPLDLRRDIKHHLCYDLVRRVSSTRIYARECSTLHSHKLEVPWNGIR